MVSVMHCKFLKISEFKKSDGTNFYKIILLEETEKDIHTLNFFLDNEIALNCKNIQYLQNIGVSFDIWFSSEGTLRYKIKNIVVEK